MSDTDRLRHLVTMVSQLLDDGQHIDQGAVVREFKQSIERVLQKLESAATSVKFMSEKSVRVASDVLMAKMLADTRDEDGDGDVDDSLEVTAEAHDLENVEIG